MTSLVQLEHLELKVSKVTTLPFDFSQLTAMNTLVVEVDTLVELPTNIGTLSQLTALKIPYKQIQTPPQDVLAALTVSATLRLLELGPVDCDCNFLPWYAEIADVNVLQNIYEAAICSDANEYSGLYPHIIRIADQGPCTHPTLTALKTGNSSIHLHWEWLELDELQSSTVITRDGLNVTSEILSCNPVKYDSINGSLYGFEIGLRNVDTGVSASTCVWASAVQGVNAYNYSYALTALPSATLYEITVRGFIANLASGTLQPLSGIGSVGKLIRTSEDVPVGAPMALQSAGAEDRLILLTWEPPLTELSNGVIESYQIEIQGFAIASSTVETYTFVGLTAATSYSARVQAKTSVDGYGPWSEYVVISTCAFNTIKLNGELACSAIDGYILTDENEAAISCASLLNSIEQVTCLSQPSMDPEQLLIAPGYWRTNPGSINIRECINSAACVGSIGSNTSSLCLLGHTGPLCDVCELDFFNNGNTCQACSATSVSNWVPLIIFLCVAGILAAAIWYGKRFVKTRLLTREQNASLGSKFKVLLTTYQIVGTFTWSLAVVFPTVYTNVVDVLLFFTFDLVKLIPPFSCAFQTHRYLSELIITGCLPLLLILPAAAVLLRCKLMLYLNSANDQPNLKRVKRIHKKQKRCYQVLIYLSFLIYTPVTNKVFRALRPCDRDFDDGGAYMPEDYGISCESEVYSSNVLPIAWMCLLFYCVGIPLFYLLLLLSHKDDILTHNQMRFNEKIDEASLKQLEDKLGAVSFLYLSYTIWWWEIYESLRKLTLTGLVVFIAPGSADQSIVLILLALLSSLIYQYAHPFRKEDNFLGIAASYAVFFIAFASLLLKFDKSFINSTLLDGLLVITAMSPVFIALLFSQSLLNALNSCLRRRQHRKWAQRIQGFLPAEVHRNAMERISTKVTIPHDESTRELTDMLFEYSSKADTINDEIEALEKQNSELKRINDYLANEALKMAQYDI